MLMASSMSDMIFDAEGSEIVFMMASATWMAGGAVSIRSSCNWLRIQYYQQEVAHRKVDYTLHTDTSE